MTSDQPAPVRAELALRHRDLDALGHVNQAVYHELLEEVRGAFFRHVLPDLPFTGYVLVHVELADLTGVEAPNLRAVAAASGLLAETLGLD